MMDNKLWRWGANVFLSLFAASVIFPFLVLFMSSISSDSSIYQHGYSIIPRDLSIEAYKYLTHNSAKIMHAFGVTVLVTVAGTLMSLMITSMLAYPLSRADLPYRNTFGFAVFFTMLFNGGLVPTYLMYTQYFSIKNSIWALIIPMLLMNGYSILIMRTFFAQTIPPEVYESARIDGGGEFRIFRSIVLPLSMPILATIGLFQTIAYWNDWMNGLIYLTDEKLYNMQNLLNQILLNIDAIASLDSTISATAADIPGLTIRMAIAFVSVVPIMLSYPFFQRYFVRGITIGSVKG
ncbi:carbohydrate ABC transporter permease [Cohnella fermenti]|uniref:Carbohydrate ABC transporter permease n=1 Tax=Cohnella fermenti TaxID=2565925 RepID=A0A4S4BKG5_9BACL|nr:carbohydrate ABC transporter permease [Cohnella fermenti]THF75220.1 carbohydrate ABC transporter permease [Cohnella fermenti]